MLKSLFGSVKGFTKKVCKKVLRTGVKVLKALWSLIKENQENINTVSILERVSPME